MFFHYFKIAGRYLLKQRMITVINVFGLTVGITVSLLIFLYVRYDLNYDRYNEKAERIYRIGLHGKMGDTEFTQTYTTPLLAQEIMNTCLEVENTVRMLGGDFYVKNENGPAPDPMEIKVGFADSTLFEVFTLEVIAGDPVNSLKEKGTVFISESTAKRVFRQPVNYAEILNSQLTMNVAGEFTPFIVRGIIRDIPDQSHFHFDAFISNENTEFSHADNWWNNGFRTYILLKEGMDINSVLEKLPGIYRKNMGGDRFDAFLAEGNRWESFAQPLLDIHLKSSLVGEWEPNSDIQNNRILLVICIFIILIACINFINLSTSKAAMRAGEIGIKKCLGSGRGQLMTQLLIESLIICFLAVNFALVIAKLFLPAFNQFTGENLDMHIIGGTGDVLLVLGFIVFLGLFSGLYPAFYLTSLLPVNALKGKLQYGKRNLYFRNMLVIFQFSIALFIIICTFLVNRQLRYVKNQNLGFNKENIIVLNNNADIDPKSAAFKSDLLKFPEVASVSVSSSVPGKGQNNVQFRPEGYADNLLLDVIFVDEDYVKTFGLSLMKGRNFDPLQSSDSVSMIINRTAMENMGWQDPLGKTIRVYGGSGIPTPVIGVINDYHYISMHDRIRPFVIIPTFSKKAFGRNYISIKIKGTGIPGILEKVKKTWKVYTDMPFDFFFLDESYDQLYAREGQIQSIFGFFSVISIFIALLGLFGLVLYNIELRTREIGIRKSFGASVLQIVILLNGNFTKWIIAGFLITIPVSWWFMKMWLSNFAYKTEISIRVYVISFILVVLTAWITSGYQTIRAALRNPVEALRYE
jgi:putative ABC transport system permease protein